MASRINQETVNRVVRELLKDKDSFLQSFKEEIAKRIEEIYLRSVPKELIDIEKKYPNSLKKLDYVMWRTYTKHFYFSIDVPAYNEEALPYTGNLQKFIELVYPTEYIQLESLVNELRIKEEDFKDLHDRITRTLKHLLFYSRIKRVYPEAYAIIEKIEQEREQKKVVSSTWSQTEKDIEEIRGKLK